MKKLIPFMMIALTGAAGLHAQDTVTSVNAVGMVKIPVETGKLVLVQVPFVSQNGPQTVENVFGDSLPVGTQIHAWNPDLQTYTSSTYVPIFGGWNPSTLDISRGFGFFIQIPSQPTPVIVDVILSGEVPDDSIASTDVVQGLQMLGFPYPVETLLSETDLGLNASAGDAIYVWDSNSGWVSSTFAPIFGGWVPDRTIQPGTAFFYLTNTVRTITETQPYSL